MREDFYQLILVTNKDTGCTKGYLDFVELCINSGVTCVQLREKSLPKEALLDFGRSLKFLLDSYQIPLIVNDDINLCVKLDALGVHLGQSDDGVMKARLALGPDKIIGLSIDNIEQIKKSKTQPINYVGIGAIFHTNSKPDVKSIWGLDKLKKACVISYHPVVAIGGIKQDNAYSVISAGAKGIAAIEAFHCAKNPSCVAQNLINFVKKKDNDR